MSIKKSILLNLTKYLSNNQQESFQDVARRNSPDYKKILVFSTTAIGDTLLSTPVFTALRQEFPQATIKVIVQKKFIPLFADNPHVDGFIPFPKGFF